MDTISQITGGSPCRGPAHEHPDLRFLLATEAPDDARPEKPDAPLRWASPGEAAELTASPSLRELLRRVRPLLASP